MNTIILNPSDTLFFKDARPMGDSLAGHGMNWPTPDIINHAICAALHRAGDTIKGQSHIHAASSNNKGKQREDERTKLFGSLTSAGAFPVQIDQNGKEIWYFPRPLDLALQDTSICYQADTKHHTTGCSSLPSPLLYPVANQQKQSKENPAPKWIDQKSYEAYLEKKSVILNGVKDADIGDFESNIGIGIDPETGTTGSGSAKGKIYSANYLRLRDHWRLGVFAMTEEKTEGSKTKRTDLIPQLFEEEGTIVIGGQQKTCTALCRQDKDLSLPKGITDFTGKRVKWILLSPAIWPQVGEHTGGWLPSWIDQNSGAVLLREKPERQPDESREVYRKRIPTQPIKTKLVAALVEKPIVITGWATGDSSQETPKFGAKSTHLAVPAGSIYYFECDSAEDANQLAKLLNWHSQSYTTISNRRSNLLGEKGFGIGICGTW